MGLYLLNISVDKADPEPEYIPEDLSFNDQESIVEIVVEKVLGFENAIKEYDDHDTEQHNKKKNVKIDLLQCTKLINGIHHHTSLGEKELFPDSEANLMSGFAEIDSPPPKS
jgi:hypothetical protein